MDSRVYSARRNNIGRRQTINLVNSTSRQPGGTFIVWRSKRHQEGLGWEMVELSLIARMAIIVNYFGGKQIFFFIIDDKELHYSHLLKIFYFNFLKK